MSEATELEIRRRLQTAMDGNDFKAELQARRELAKVLGPRAGVGGGRTEMAARHAGIDTETGSPALERAGLSVKMTPEGKSSFLAEKYGEGNVSRLPNGQFIVKDGDWRTVEDSGFSMRDIADLAGPVVEAAPPVATGFLTANPLAVGAAAAGGNALRQGLSAMLPGDDQMSLGDRAQEVAISGGIGLASQYGANKLAGMADKMRPHNVIARSVQRSMQSPTAKRGEFLGHRTGIDFLPGQRSGSKAQLTVEGLVRRHPASADKMQAMDERQVNRAYDYIRNLQKKVSPSGGGAVTAGDEVSKGFRRAVDSAVSRRSAQWQKDFAPVISAAGDAKIMPLNNTRSAVQRIIDDFDVPGGGDMTASLVNRLKSIMGDLEKPLTAKQTQRLLQLYGKVSRGQGQLFKDIDAGQQREVGRKVFAALQKDLDDFADGGVQGDHIVQALRNARTHWRQNSQALDDLEGSVLGRLMGGKYDPAPERIADKFLTMRGSEIRQAISVLDQSNPQAMELVRGNMLEQALRKANPAASGDNIVFSPAKFSSYLKSHSEQFQAAFLGSKKNAQLGQLKHAYEALGRIANRAGTDGSPTAPLMLAWDMAQSSFTMNPVGLARNAATILTPNKIAKILTTESGRKALITLKSVKPGTKAAMNAGAVITGILTKESRAESADMRAEDASDNGTE